MFIGIHHGFASMGISYYPRENHSENLYQASQSDFTLFHLSLFQMIQRDTIDVGSKDEQLETTIIGTNTYSNMPHYLFGLMNSSYFN